MTSFCRRNSSFCILPIIPTAFLSYMCSSEYNPTEQKSMGLKAWWRTTGATSCVFRQYRHTQSKAKKKKKISERRGHGATTTSSSCSSELQHQQGQTHVAQREKWKPTCGFFFSPRKYLPTLRKLTTKFYTRNSMLANTELPLCCRDNSVPVNELSFGQMLGYGTP